MLAPQRARVAVTAENGDDEPKRCRPASFTRYGVGSLAPSGLGVVRVRLSRKGDKRIPCNANGERN